MARTIRISEEALRWLVQEAETIARDFGGAAARDFQARINGAIERIAVFPGMTERGKIPGTRTFVVNRRTILTIVERNGDLIIAAARSHRQNGDETPP